MTEFETNTKNDWLKILQIFFQLYENQGKVKIWWNFVRIPNFCNFHSRKLNKYFWKLQTILRNFSSWQFFLLVKVYKIFGFEIRNFKQWSCNISQRYCNLVYIFLPKKNKPMSGNVLVLISSNANSSPRFKVVVWTSRERPKSAPYLRLNKLWNLWKKSIMLYENWKRYIRTLKTLHPNFENVTSELWKCYIRTLKTLHPNFENVASELWKHYIRTLKTLLPNFENITSELWIHCHFSHWN